MQDEELAVAIMAATVKAVNVPVTVKMRLGWDEQNLNAPRLAKMAEDVGIQMVTVHGRTRNQMYKGTADWEAIAAVREATALSLIVNGDIMSPQDASDAMAVSGADGVMIGRGASGKPWLLNQTMQHLRGETISPPPPPKEISTLVIEHYDAMLAYYGERQGVAIARKHLAWYCTDLPGAAAFRAAINKVKEPDVVKTMVADFFTQVPIS